MSFENSYLGQLRKKIGHDLVIIPGTRIVLENPANEILLERRTDFGLWGLPGGAAEADASAQETIIREVKEETGLTVYNVKSFGISSDPTLETVYYPNGDILQGYVILFTRNSVEGSLQI